MRHDGTATTAVRGTTTSATATSAATPAGDVACLARMGVQRAASVFGTRTYVRMYDEHVVEDEVIMATQVDDMPFSLDSHVLRQHGRARGGGVHNAPRAAE